MEAVSLVRRNHIELLQRFVKGGGTEFLPLKDPVGNRKPFLEHLTRANELEVRQRQMIKLMIDEGRFLLYLQPNGRSYRIHVFSRDQYQVDRNADGEIESACIIYSYKLKKRGQKNPIDRWIKLWITTAEIWTHESETMPDFDEEFPEVPDLAPLPNVFGYVPCVEVLNPTSDKRGESDFAELEAHIDAHDVMSEAILDNIEFFCRSPVVTTRDAEEVEEHLYEAQEKNARNSVARASGFKRNDSISFKPRRRLKKVLGGFEDGEEIKQLDINPVPADLLQYADRYEEKLRQALGGVAETGIETATETRIVYGGVEVTAREKREALYTYGLCKLLEMAIRAEEALFLESQRTARTEDELIGLQPGFDENGKSVGCEVVYRTAPVFTPTTKDILDRSIVGRNLQRLGVDVKETLRRVFPEMSDDELSQIIGQGGIPVEYLQDAMSLMQTLLSLVDPTTQGAIVDPSTNLPLAYSLIPLITNALNYGEQFKQPFTYTDPTTDRAERLSLAAAAARIALERQFAATGENINDSGASRVARQSLGLSQPLPRPGSVVAEPNRNWVNQYFPTFAAWGNAVSNLFSGTRSDG